MITAIVLASSISQLWFSSAALPFLLSLFKDLTIRATSRISEVQSGHKRKRPGSGTALAQARPSSQASPCFGGLGVERHVSDFAR